jgi:hypothetical protein
MPWPIQSDGDHGNRAAMLAAQISKGYTDQLETLLKLVLAIALFYGVYAHHVASGRVSSVMEMVRAEG